MARDSEQACEAQHYDFLSHFTNFKVPATQFEAPASSADPPEPPPVPVPGPLSGTRSGQTALRQAQRAPGSRATPVQPRAAVSLGNLDLARRRTLRSVISYNATKMPPSDVCTDRMLKFGALCENMEPAKIFISRGRCGDDRAMFVKQYTSNDNVSK